MFDEPAALLRDLVVPPDISDVISTANVINGDNPRMPCQRLLGSLVADAANASGASRREIRAALSHDFVHIALRSRTYVQVKRFVEPVLSKSLVAGRFRHEELCVQVENTARAGAQPVVVVDPLTALWTFLEWLIRVGRRADVSRQLAVQRLRLLCRALRSSPEVPPGEVVVASACVPRGPDLSRVVSALLSTIRGDRLALV